MAIDPSPDSAATPGEVTGSAFGPGDSDDNDGTAGDGDGVAGDDAPGNRTDDAPPPDAYIADDALRFQPPRGLRSTPTSLELSTSVDGGTIFYTLDGREPSSTTGTPYAGPITLEGTATVRAVVEVSGMAATPIATHTYVFPAQVLRQGDVRPEGPHVFWTTEMDPEVVDDPAYSGMIEDAFSTIPSMSIVAPDAAIFGLAGIHRGNNLMPAGGSHGGDDPHPDFVEEVHVSLEMFYPEAFPRPTAGGFQTDCGLKAQGGGGRWDNGEYDHKQSFGLRFRTEYGNPSLSYPVFEDAPLNGDSEAGKYDKLILRAGHNKSWGATWDNEHSVYTRDQLGRDLQIDMSGLGARGTFVHLYINGLYWGLYNLTERPDDAHASNYLGGKEAEHYVGKAKGGDVDGDGTRFQHWRDSIASGSDFAQLQAYLAVDAYIDMALINAYAATGDFPQYYFTNRFGAEPGPIYFWNWDIEDAFGGGSRRSGGPSADRLRECYELETMWESYPEFRERFVARADQAVAEGGALSDASVTARWNTLNAYIEDAIVLESARWGDERIADTGERYTRDEHWIAARDAVTRDLEGRAQALIDELRASSHAGVPFHP
ncbi:MAG: CotH kinase family protein [Myxococcales bacterium]|jgi:hypothetical protein